MISFLRDIPFLHGECKDKVRQLIQQTLNDDKRIQSLNSQILGFINQIQELKAIHNYTTFDLEKKITELESKLVLESSKKPKKENVS
jgi:hypothetical protein